MKAKISNLTSYERARGCLLAHALGDALGGPFEGMDPLTISHQPHYYDLHPSFTTDDTAMALALGNSIVKAGRYEPHLALEHYLEWYRGGAFGIGRNTRFVLSAVDEGIPYQEATRQAALAYPERRVTNGALMRLSSLAVAYYDHPDLIKLARADASLTHYHQLAHDASEALAKLLSTALKGDDLSFEGQGLVGEAFSWGSDYLETHAYSLKGYVLVALACAKEVFERFTDFREAMNYIVGLGGDTDTNAAIVGGLWGAYYGSSALPGEWINGVGISMELLELADNLVGVGLNSVPTK